MFRSRQLPVYVKFDLELFAPHALLLLPIKRKVYRRRFDPPIFIATLDSISFSTALLLRMPAIVSSTFFRASASTKAVFFEERSPLNEVAFTAGLIS